MATFNKTKCEAICDDIESFFKELGEKHDVTLRFGKMTYSADIAKAGVTITLNDESGEAVSEEEIAWKNSCHKFNLPLSGLDKVVKINGKPFQITGLNPRAPKNAVCLINLHGKKFKCSPKMALDALRGIA